MSRVTGKRGLQEGILPPAAGGRCGMDVVRVALLGIVGVLTGLLVTCG